MMNANLRGLLIAVVIGMPIASYFFVFKPLNTEILQQKSEVEHKEQLLVKLQEETARNADLERSNAEIQNSIKVIEARLPSNKEVDNVVRNVSDLADSCKLQAPAMKTLRPIQTALYMEQPIDIEVSGDFLGFFTFLASIEKLPRITRIHDLKITGHPRDGVELKADFTLSIYFQDEAQLAQGGGK
jgi:type IV pilus assembly protein PilO